MAGSATIISNKINGKWRTIVWRWTSDASGDVSGVGAVAIPGGVVNTILSVPDSGGESFVLTVTGKIFLDSGETVSVADLLNGVGATMAASTDGEAKNVSVTYPIPYNVEIAPVISSAGNAKSGYLFLFVWQE